MENSTRRSLLGEIKRGVICGLVVQKPASLLVATYDGGYIRCGSTNLTQPSTEFAVAGSTITVTASKDSYIYVDGTGAVQKLEVAQNATKPTNTGAASNDIGASSEFIAKVVNDGTNITSVTDLRGFASHPEIATMGPTDYSFLTGAVGTAYVKVPFNGRLIAIDGVVKTAIAASDNGTLTYSIGANDVFTAVTGGVLTATASDAIGTRYNVTPTALNAIKRGNYLKIVGAKTTSGGVVQVVTTWLVGTR